jgi:hypothetical protein
MAGNMNQSFLEMNNHVVPTIPTYYVRYEDLILQPLPTLTELFCFLLEVPSIAGTIVETRIQDYCDGGSNRTATVYRLKTADITNLSRNADMYTSKQLEMLKLTMREFLYYFKYTDDPRG